jgi:hypothetical protein
MLMAIKKVRSESREDETPELKVKPSPDFGAMKSILDEACEMAEEDDEVADALLGFDPDEDDKPEYVADGGLWKKAVKVIDPEGVGAKYDHPYRVAAALYKLMGGKFIMGDSLED